MNIIAKISAKLAGRDLYSGSEPGHLESPSKWAMFSALGKTEHGAEDFCWDMAL